ncbi:DUF2878 domain-containing protein [Vibrio fluminensis]|uniref:DUF2878 domain-containing protein n=1 Tax=Vibrio fluminensis TaxID=2783614 RepID=UPI0018870764|nr:DUF2878 domain-containing protein [Vibrio fluminensis]
MSQLKRLLIISTLFQMVWFAAVLGKESWQWAVLLGVTCLILVTARREEFNWRIWLILTIIGVVLDSVNIKFGLIAFESAFIPIWLVALWGGFCWYALFLGKIVSHYPTWIVSIVGGLAGALSYLAGYKLGAVSLGFSLPVAIVLFFIQWLAFVFFCMKMINVGAKHHEHGKDNLV